MKHLRRINESKYSITNKGVTEILNRASYEFGKNEFDEEYYTSLLKSIINNADQSQLDFIIEEILKNEDLVIAYIYNLIDIFIKDKSEKSFKKLTETLKSTPKKEWQHIVDYLINIDFNNEVKKICEFLFNNGFDINTPYMTNGQNLIFCAFYMPKETLEYLISKGLNIHHTDNKGDNVLCYQELDHHTLDLLINNGIKIPDKFLDNSFYVVADDKGTKLWASTILLMLKKNPEIYIKIKDKLKDSILKKIPNYIKNASNLGIL